VTVLVFVTGETAREQAEVMMLPGYLLNTDGTLMARFCTPEMVGEAGSAKATTPLIVVRGEFSRLLKPPAVAVVVVVVGKLNTKVVIMVVLGTIVVVGTRTIVVVESVSVAVVVVGKTNVVVVERVFVMVAVDSIVMVVVPRSV
jgi:hypothetical protein